MPIHGEEEEEEEAAPEVPSLREGALTGEQPAGCDPAPTKPDPEARQRGKTMTDQKKPPDAGEDGVEATGDARLDALLSRMHEKAAVEEALTAAEAEIEPQRGPESARSDAPRGRGRVETAEIGTGPPEVRPVIRPDPILPRIRIEENPAEEAARIAFGGLTQGGDEPIPGQLPLFREPDGPRVPILELADARGGPIMAQGRGAPLDLRIFVAACVMFPFEATAEGAPGRVVRLSPTVRMLRDFCFPNGWQRGRDWPKMRAALRRLYHHAIPGPFHWPGRGIVRDWIPLVVKGGATEDAELDDVVVLEASLPPGGKGDGPTVEARELFRLGVQSAPRFRAYIATHQLAWRPGVSRRPHPRNRSFHVWSSNPANYLVLTREDRRRLAFGRADRRDRTRANQDAAWETLPGCRILTKEAATPDGRRGWLVVPEGAAKAVNRRGQIVENEDRTYLTGQFDLPNRTI